MIKSYRVLELLETGRITSSRWFPSQRSGKMRNVDGWRSA